MEKILSVVIPSYNAAKYLREDIPTFLDKQILDKIEIIIVNDGSKDDTLSVAQEFSSEYPDSIIVINKENGGHGSTINAGAGVASGKYFKVVDADDWVDTVAFAEYVNYLENIDVDMVIAPYTTVFIDSDKREVHCMYSEYKENTSYVFDQIASSLTEYAMHSVAYKTGIVKAQKNISEHCFYVDMEYICNPVKDIETVSFFHKSVYQYRLGTAEQSVSLANRQKNRAMQRKVTLNVISLLNDKSLTVEKSTFLERLAGRLIAQQTDILLSFRADKRIKSELMDFYSEINKIRPDILKKNKGKKVAILNIFGFVVYSPLAFLVRITKTYH